jgi:MFS family permease
LFLENEILIFFSLWLQGIALVLPSLQVEFGISQTHVRYTTCALFVGLCVGASFWGIGSDIIGRRLAFNLTLLIAGVFGIASGAAPNWIGACGLFAALGVGVGGNLPVDVSVAEFPFLSDLSQDFTLGECSIHLETFMIEQLLTQ